MTKLERAKAVAETLVVELARQGVKFRSVRVDNAVIPATMGREEAEKDPPFMVVIEHPHDQKIGLPADFGGDVEVRTSPFVLE